MSLISLPNELLDNIVDKIAHGAHSSLEALALVSRCFLGRCRYHLFHTIRYSASPPNSKLEKMLRANPSLFHYPRTLIITQCFDLLLYDEFVVDGRFLRMAEQLESLRNLDIIDEEHPDSIPRWEEMPVALKTAYRTLLSRPLIHLSICLPKGFPDHLIYSIPTLQYLSIDDVTASLADLVEIEGVRSDSSGSWSLRSFHHCHRGEFCMPLLRSMSPPHPMFAKLTRLAIDVTKIEGHVFAWSKLLPAFRKHLLSLTLRYTGPSSRYPGNGNKAIVSAALKDVTSHARTFPSFPLLRYLQVELHHFNSDRDPPHHLGRPTAIPAFHPLFLNSILGAAPQRLLLTFNSELNWTTAFNGRWHAPTHPSLGKVIYEDSGWRQLDDTLSSHGLFPNLTAVRMRTAVSDRGRLFMSYDDRTPVCLDLKSQVAEAMEKTRGRVRVFDAGDEVTQMEFDDFVDMNR